MDSLVPHRLVLLGDVRWHAGSRTFPFEPERRYQVLALLACHGDGVTG